MGLEVAPGVGALGPSIYHHYLGTWKLRDMPQDHVPILQDLLKCARRPLKKEACNCMTLKRVPSVTEAFLTFMIFRIPTVCNSDTTDTSLPIRPRASKLRVVL